MAALHSPPETSSTTGRYWQDLLAAERTDIYLKDLLKSQSLLQQSTIIHHLLQSGLRDLDHTEGDRDDVIHLLKILVEYAGTIYRDAEQQPSAGGGCQMSTTDRAIFEAATRACEKTARNKTYQKTWRLERIQRCRQNGWADFPKSLPSDLKGSNNLEELGNNILDQWGHVAEKCTLSATLTILRVQRGVHQRKQAKVSLKDLRFLLQYIDRHPEICSLETPMPRDIQSPPALHPQDSKVHGAVGPTRSSQLHTPAHARRAPRSMSEESPDVGMSDVPAWVEATGKKVVVSARGHESAVIGHQKSNLGESGKGEGCVDSGGAGARESDSNATGSDNGGVNDSESDGEDRAEREVENNAGGQVRYIPGSDADDSDEEDDEDDDGEDDDGEDDDGESENGESEDGESEDGEDDSGEDDDSEFVDDGSLLGGLGGKRRVNDDDDQAPYRPAATAGVALVHDKPQVEGNPGHEVEDVASRRKKRKRSVRHKVTMPRPSDKSKYPVARTITSLAPQYSLPDLIRLVTLYVSSPDSTVATTEALHSILEALFNAGLTHLGVTQGMHRAKREAPPLQTVNERSTRDLSSQSLVAGEENPVTRSSPPSSQPQSLRRSARLHEQGRQRGHIPQQQATPEYSRRVYHIWREFGARAATELQPKSRQEERSVSGGDIAGNIDMGEE